MYTLRHTITRYLLVPLSLICTSALYAADHVTRQQSSWPWWHEAHGHSFWWIFPLIFFVIMIVIFIFMMRRGGMGCMWRNRMMDSSEFRDAMKRSWGERSESALEILDKRFARGEIEKQEYEEKKAVLAHATEK